MATASTPVDLSTADVSSDFSTSEFAYVTTVSYGNMGYWNMDDYNIPSDPNYHHNFIDALDLMGFVCRNLNIHGYGVDHLERSPEDIPYVAYIKPEFRNYDDPSDGSLERIVMTILNESVYFVEPTNFFIISRRPPPGTELDRVLECLHLRLCGERGRGRILLVEPIDDEFSVDSVVASMRFVDGRKPRAWRETDLMLPLVSVPSDKPDPYKIQDFSKPVPTYAGPRAAVFWDLEDHAFPFPRRTLDAIFSRLRSQLIDMGLTAKDQFSIWCYFDETQSKSPLRYSLDTKTWESNIYLLPGGADKHARRKRMLHDILLWAIDNPLEYLSITTYLIVVTGEVGLGFHNILSNLETVGYIVYHIDSISSDPSDLSWPRDLLDEGDTPRGKEEASKAGKKAKT